MKALFNAKRFGRQITKELGAMAKIGDYLKKVMGWEGEDVRLAAARTAAPSAGQTEGESKLGSAARSR